MSLGMIAAIVAGAVYLIGFAVTAGLAWSATRSIGRAICYGLGWPIVAAAVVLFSRRSGG